MTTIKDKRKHRTRTALMAAFNELVLDSSGRDIRVAEIIVRADIGRSTFYEHYSSVNDIHMQALSQPLSILADAITERNEYAELVCLLEHFRENRVRAQQTFSDSKTRDQATWLLVLLLEERVPHERAGDSTACQLATLQLAEATLGLVRAWIADEISCSTKSIATAIRKSSKLILSEVSTQGTV